MGHPYSGCLDESENFTASLPVAPASTRYAPGPGEQSSCVSTPICFPGKKKKKEKANGEKKWDFFSSGKRF
jgi:hypothetical protein